MKQPSDFYFSFTNYEDLGDCVIIIRKDIWDYEKRWSDDSEEFDLVYPLGFYQITEAVYEIPFCGAKEARENLLKEGFIENPEILDETYWK